jgi:ribosomal protein S18 acetylase RimI-like enzyme
MHRESASRWYQQEYCCGAPEATPKWRGRHYRRVDLPQPARTVGQLLTIHTRRAAIRSRLAQVAALEFHEARLLDQWRDAHPDAAVPPEVARLKGWQCVIDSRMVGHCIGDSISGEIISLSVESAYRRQRIGGELLSLVVDALRAAGVTRVWLACPPDRALPAYGFYRAVGWVPTGEHTRDGHEILEPRATSNG